MKIKIPPVFAELLRKRGICGVDSVNDFLFPKLKDLKHPKLMKNLEKASETIASYILSNRRIVIWGDYDVDGTTGTALLVNFFKECGKEVTWHIPNRLTEGYGLNLEWFVEKKRRSDMDDFLLITVDCGISNHQVIDGIQAIGGTVIVTDHHSIPRNGIPQCLILNPSQLDCGFSGDCLAGVGVAFYLASGIRGCLQCSTEGNEKVKNINLKHYLAFVALGTIADVVELTPTNRILVRGGLEILPKTIFVGIKKLLSSCDIVSGEPTTEDIGYLIGPKINAAGRLGESSIVVELFTEQDPRKAKALAQKMSELNELRKEICSENLESILRNTSADMAHQDRCVIEYGDIHQGVAGIVASRLVDLYGFPAIVFAKKTSANGQSFFVGSARSTSGIDILEAISEHSDLITKFGGHKMAAGLTLEESAYENFKRLLTETLKEAQKKTLKKIVDQFDVSCPVKTLMSNECLEFFKYLEPFGPGNNQPVFQDNEAVIVDAKAVGREKEHLQLTIRGTYSNIKGIGFNLGTKINEVQAEPHRKLIYSPTKNRYRGTVSWQVRVTGL